MGNIYSVRGNQLSHKDIHLLSQIPPPIMRQVGALINREKISGDQINTLLKELGDRIIHLLGIIDKLPISENRKRAVCMISAFHNSTICVVVPQDFIPNVEEKQRTKVYMLVQAYLSSHRILAEHKKDPINFFKELPNTIYAAYLLHYMGIFPDDVLSNPHIDSFFVESIKLLGILQKGIRSRYIINTPELQEIFDIFSLRVAS